MKLIDILVEELPKRGGWPGGAAFVAQEEGGWLWSFTSKPQKDCDDEWMDESSSGYHNKVGKLPEASDHDTSSITRDQYEAALAAKNDGWINWGGGECPVPIGTLVDVKYRCGDVNYHIKAGEPDEIGSINSFLAVRWSKIGAEYDIIAYRLHQSKEVAQTKAEQEADLNECIGQELVTTWSGEGLPQVGCECEYRKHKKHEQSEWFNGVVKYASEFTVVIQHVCYPGETVGHPANFEFRPIRSEAEQRRHDAAQALCYAGGGIGKVDESAGIGSCWFDVYDAIAAGKIPGLKLED